MKQIIEKALFLWLVLGLHGQAFADWKPEYLRESFNKNELNDPKYLKLKSKVLQFLANSWCSTEKANLLMDIVTILKPNTCVEIGVYTGSSLLPIAASLKRVKNGRVYAIDAWSNDIATQHLTSDDPNRKTWEQTDLRHAYKMFRKMINIWKLESVCQEIYSSSKMAVNKVDSIDFLHIDGSYSEESSYEDVQFYLPKVKKGGYILFTFIGWTVNGKMPRIKAFQLLLDHCEIIADIDERNTFLVRKLVN